MYGITEPSLIETAYPGAGVPLDLWALFQFGLGIVLLVVGAEQLVRGSARLAGAIGISPLVVGLTVVAFGTSSPELAVSVNAALAGKTEVALGNVLGSNICNTLLILGLSAVVAPLVVHRQLIRVDVPLMIGASIALVPISLDGRVGRWEGLLLLGVLAIYLTLAVRSGRRRNPAETRRGMGRRRTRRRTREILLRSLQSLLGLGLLVLGSQWLVDGAVVIATALGLSELVVGLTIVALGTSLPEVATSVVAALRGQRDIAIGNVVGSNLFNILAVLGATATVAPAGIPVPRGVLTFDIPVVIVSAVACLPVFYTGLVVSRWEGLLFFSYYVSYTGFLILQAANHAALQTFSFVMTWFALPLTAVGLTASVVAARFKRRATSPLR